MNPINTAPVTVYCGQCIQFEKSKMEPYGYCRAAPTLVLRARLLQGDEVCHFPSRYQSGGQTS